MEVSATIGQATGNNWTAIGFADRPAAAFVTSGQVWMLLTSNQWKVKVGPTLIATGSLLGAAPHRARLRYDPLSRTITALVDDIVVVDGFDVDDMTSPPPITITDVGMHIKQNGGDLDDFEVRLDCQR